MRAPSRLSTCTSGTEGELDVAVEADDREAVLDEAGDPLGRQHEPVDERAVDVLGAQQRR